MANLVLKTECKEVLYENFGNECRLVPGGLYKTTINRCSLWTEGANPTFIKEYVPTYDEVSARATYQLNALEGLRTKLRDWDQTLRRLVPVERGYDRHAGFAWKVVRISRNCYKDSEREFVSALHIWEYQIDHGRKCQDLNLIISCLEDIVYFRNEVAEVYYNLFTNDEGHENAIDLWKTELEDCKRLRELGRKCTFRVSWRVAGYLIARGFDVRRKFIKRRRPTTNEA